MHEIWFALWFFLPAGIANAAPVFANKIPGINRFKVLMDFGKSFRGKRIFGDNKSWRGLIFGTIAAAAAGALEYGAFPRVGHVGLNVSSGWTFGVLTGALLGCGALAGDAAESFIKRQFGVKPGQHWFPFDQIDYIIGGLLLSSIVVRLRLIDYIAILLVWFSLHLIASYLGYLVGLKQKPI